MLTFATKAKPLPILVLIVLLALPSFVHAQQPRDPCDPAGVLMGMPDPSELFDEPADDVWGLLRTVAAVILRADAQCKGLFWVESGDRLLGPIDIPAGYYRATAEGSGKFVLNLTPLDGQCGHIVMTDYFSPLLFSEMNAANGLEVLLTSQGCTAMLEVESDTRWSLVFEGIQ